jgi:aspartate aminotransferase
VNFIDLLFILIYGGMKLFSEKMLKNLAGASGIRAMFSEGIRLSKIYGKDKVYDFSLGNPYFEPPSQVHDSMKHYISDEQKGIHKYMNNLGFDDVRENIAKTLQMQSGVELSMNNIAMVVGAAGGLNVVLKSILNDEDEVIVFAPFFTDYKFYIDNSGGKVVIIPADTKTFEPNLEEFKKAITDKTKAIIINTPNNPTGVVYSEAILRKMAAVIEECEDKYNTDIFVISDEPYSKIIYDNLELPQVLDIFKNGIIVTSFSKSLNIAGERIGYIAISSKIENANTLMDLISFSNRILGFVNAPALFQKVISDCINIDVDTSEYLNRRDILYKKLTELGYECIKPQGAFYLFPKAPIEDDAEFVKRALKYNLIFVPGSSFGCPGYFRISYCVDLQMINNSFEALEQLTKEFK